MKKLLALLALTPVALTACGEEAVVKTTVNYTLGHGKYTDANNGNKGTQNTMYNVIESKVTSTDGTLTYDIKESTKYLDVTASDTTVTIPTTAEATPTWTAVGTTSWTPKPADFAAYINALTYPFNLPVKGSDSQGTVAQLAKSSYENNLNTYYTAYSALSDTEKAALVDSSGNGTVPMANDALRYVSAVIDFASYNVGTEFSAAQTAAFNAKYPKIDVNNNGTPIWANNTGESLRYIHGVIEVDAAFKDKLTDGAGATGLAFEAKTTDNYGGGRFDIKPNLDKLIAHANATYNTCEKAKAVTDATIKGWAKDKDGISDVISGATFSEGGIYLASLVTAAKKNCAV